MPLPEADGGGVRPGVKEPAGPGLPPLGKGKASPKTSSRDVKEEIGELIHTHNPLMDAHLHTLHHFSRQAQESAQDQGKEKQKEQPRTAVKKLLGRDLTPAERILVTQMHRRGKKPAEMADILSKLKPVAP
jgi:hypothetical protein